jgi:hypothetical protein
MRTQRDPAAFARQHLARVDGLADCFQFKDLTPILRDLHRLPPKELTDAEVQRILDDEPPPIEVAIVDFLTEQAEATRRTTLRGRIQAGMKEAPRGSPAAGKHVGRPAGQVEDAEAFLAKPSNQRVITALEDGLSIRNAAAAAGVAPNTALKIKRLLDDQGDDVIRSRGGNFCAHHTVLSEDNP